MIQALFPAAERVNVDAGHCPHDENPTDVNNAILDFMAKIHPRSA
jgi:pimeloyl-ACP methyl ester carboxylesterase